MGGELPLEGRVAVVTGGGRGIGCAVAIGFAEAGADVAVIGRRVDVLESAVAEISARGRKGLAQPADLRETARIPELFDRIKSELGGLDIIVRPSSTSSCRRFPR